MGLNDGLVSGSFPTAGQTRSGVDPELAEVVVHEPAQSAPTCERQDDARPKLNRVAPVNSYFSATSKHDERLVVVELVLDRRTGGPLLASTGRPSPRVLGVVSARSVKA
jgi:hypothetical protein